MPRTFVFTVLSFVWQLEDVPEKILQEEIATLRKFTPGPGNWVSKLDLFHLQDELGFCISYPSIATTALAAKLRVAATDIKDVENKHTEL